MASIDGIRCMTIEEIILNTVVYTVVRNAIYRMVMEVNDTTRNSENKAPQGLLFLVGLCGFSLWRRGWDLNPRAPSLGQLDFESSALRPLRYLSREYCFIQEICHFGGKSNACL